MHDLGVCWACVVATKQRVEFDTMSMSQEKHLITMLHRDTQQHSQRIQSTNTKQNQPCFSAFIEAKILTLLKDGMRHYSVLCRHVEIVNSPSVLA